MLGHFPFLLKLGRDAVHLAAESNCICCCLPVRISSAHWEFLNHIKIKKRTVFIIQKITSIKSILNNVIDFTVLDVFEPCPRKKSDQSQNKSFLTPSFNNATEFCNNGTKFFKFMYAKRVLSMAQCDNQAMRLHAVEHLATIQLEPWQYSLLAHMCDARTAVGLARTQCVNHKFFLPPIRKYGTYNNRILFHTMKDYLNSLYDSHTAGHPCIKKVLSKVFNEAHDEYIIDIDHDTELLSNIVKDAELVLPKCLESLRHHSTFPKYARDILTNNGLYLLMEVYNRFSDNVGVCISLCNIIANVSTQEDVLQEIFRSGWIAILAEWINSPDVRISGPASQALANLDRDEIEKLPPNIYLLHPKYRTQEQLDVDVVFVHGLLGNVFYTWRNNIINGVPLDIIGKKKTRHRGETIGFNTSTTEPAITSDPATREYISELQEILQIEWDAIGNDFEFIFYDIPEVTNDEATGPYSSSKSAIQPHKPTQCWAGDWLPHDCSNIRVMGVNYNTSLSTWAHICPDIPNGLTLNDRSTCLLDNLVKAGIGKRPIVWVTHSMGGLLVKNVLAMSKNSKNIDEKNISQNTKSIFFYSTPHFGSKSANLNQPTSYVIWPSTEVQELRENSPNLIRIHNDFLDVLKDIDIKIYSFVETRPTVVSALKLNFTLVEPSSGYPGVGEYYEIPQSHLAICKPTNRESFLYQKVLDVVRKTVAETRNK